MANKLTDSHLAQAINIAIEAEINKAVEAAANEAADKARQAVRASVGKIVMSILSEFDVARDGKNLIIRVRHQGGAP